MLQNTRVTAFTVSESLRENQQDGGGRGVKLPPTKIRVNSIVNQINYGLIKEENFTINLCKND